MDRRPDSHRAGETSRVVGSGFGRIQDVRLPDSARLFARRAARFRGLAAGHALGPFLEFLAQLADAQDTATRTCEERRWRASLDVIVARMRQNPLRAESAAALDRLASAAPADLDLWANSVLGHSPSSPPDTATAPFIAAALQVHWTELAAELAPETLQVAGGECPVCASPPAAGLVLSGTPLRYLVCPLCATEWHATRLTCTACMSGASLSYFMLEGGEPGVKAEACGACRTYLKLFYLEDRPLAEAVADDVASFALDALMAEEGYARAGASWLVTAM